MLLGAPEAPPPTKSPAGKRGGRRGGGGAHTHVKTNAGVGQRVFCVPARGARRLGRKGGGRAGRGGEVDRGGERSPTTHTRARARWDSQTMGEWAHSGGGWGAHLQHFHNVPLLLVAVGVVQVRAFSGAHFQQPAHGTAARREVDKWHVRFPSRRCPPLPRNEAPHTALAVPATQASQPHVGKVRHTFWPEAERGCAGGGRTCMGEEGGGVRLLVWGVRGSASTHPPHPPPHTHFSFCSASLANRDSASSMDLRGMLRMSR